MDQIKNYKFLMKTIKSNLIKKLQPHLFKQLLFMYQINANDFVICAL